MARPKSILQRIEFDEAKKAHNCQRSKQHRLEKGDRRLKVRNGRSWDHYCYECATAILRSDIAKLKSLLDKFEES